MKKNILTLIFFAAAAIGASAQTGLGVDKSSASEKLDVDGAVRIEGASKSLEGTMDYQANLEKFRVNVGGTWYTLSPVVGFLARTTSHRSGAQYVVYNDTKHNVGNAYNTSNGIFTAPVDGLYHFCWGGIEYTSSTLTYLYLRVNNSNYYGNGARMRFDGAENYGEGNSCATVNLKKGDTVRIYMSSGGVYQTYSFFTGHLVSTY